METRECRECREVKLLSEFHRDSSKRGGYRSICKKCVKIYQIAHRGAEKPQPIRKLIDGVWHRCCGKCKEWKAFSEFNKRADCIDGLDPNCRVCATERTKKSATKWMEKTLRIVQESKENGIILTKVCTMCNTEKVLSEFRFSKNGKYGRTGKCLICLHKKWAIYSKNNKDKIRERSRKKRGRRPRQIIRRIENGIRYKRCSSCERWLEYDDFYFHQRSVDGRFSYCKFCCRLRRHKYRKHVWEKGRGSIKPKEISSRTWSLVQSKIQGANNRAKIWKSDGTFTAIEFISLCRQYQYMCIHPDHMGVMPLDKLTPDHVVPLALGGDNSISNIQPLCHKHNREKQITIVDYRWL